jgi:hypothetical protein
MSSTTVFSQEHRSEGVACDMLTLDGKAHFVVDPQDIEHSFDRVPFSFAHNLHEMELLQFDSVRALADKYIDADYFVSSGARSADTKFYAVPHGALAPRAALDALEPGPYRVLMKRPEHYDPRFRSLLDTLFEQVVDMRGGLGNQHVVRLESSILVSSAISITPFHFDPEISFFFHIEGEKIYHIYPPAMMTEPELERFYKMGIVNIGHADFEARGRANEYVFALAPGRGFHQPQNSPHWVQTGASRTISYVFSFETNLTREVGRTRTFNHYMRKCGLQPAVPGSHPFADAAKAKAMQLAIPLRRGVRNALRKTFGR